MESKEQEIIAIIAQAIPDNNEGLIIRELAVECGWGRAAAIILKHNPQLKPQLEKIWDFMPEERVYINDPTKYGVISHVNLYSGSYTVKEYLQNGTMSYTREYTNEQLLSYNPDKVK